MASPQPEMASPSTKASQNITNYRNQGKPFLDQPDKSTLMEMLKANQQYFNSQPVLTDNEYDILKEYVEDRFPDMNLKLALNFHRIFQMM